MQWAADWPRYPKAISRPDALWRKREALRLEGTYSMSLSWRDHARPPQTGIHVPRRTVRGRQEIKTAMGGEPLPDAAPGVETPAHDGAVLARRKKAYNPKVMIRLGHLCVGRPATRATRGSVRRCRARAVVLPRPHRGRTTDYLTFRVNDKTSSSDEAPRLIVRSPDPITHF